MNKLYVEFRELLSADPKEEIIHQFINENSFILQFLGHAVKKVFSKPKMGSEFIPDFAIAGWGNYIVWTFVELERSDHKLFTKEGLISNPLNRAIHQVNSWWVWLYDHGAYATSEFYKLSGDYTASIVIGRRESLSSRDIKLLAQINKTQLSGKLRIITYDTILDELAELSDYDIGRLKTRELKLREYKSIKEWTESSKNK